MPAPSFLFGVVVGRRFRFFVDAVQFGGEAASHSTEFGGPYQQCVTLWLYGIPLLGMDMANHLPMEFAMKTMLVTVAALMMLTACGAPDNGGCEECEKMAIEANAAHKAKLADAAKKDCDCCKGGMGHH